MNNLLCGIFLLLIAFFFYFTAISIPVSFLSDNFGPSGLPVIYSYLLSIIALIQILHGGIQIYRSGAPNIMINYKFDGSLKNPFLLLMIGYLYIFILFEVGYLVSSFLLLSTILYFLSNLKIYRILLISIIGSAAYWLIFSQLFNTRLPSGWIF